MPVSWPAWCRCATSSSVARFPAAPGAWHWSGTVTIQNYANNPYNGCPSVHVSTCTLTMISAMVSGFSPAVKMAILALETAIIISTLTTEQHVIVDVIWGIVLGIVGWLLTGLMFV